MNKRYEIKTIAFYRLYLSIVILFILVTYICIIQGYSDTELLIAGLGFLTSGIILIRLFRGLFVVELIDDRILRIEWIKAPIFTNKRNREIKVNEIEGFDTPWNFSWWVPNKFIIKLKSSKNFSFYVPVINVRDDFEKLKENLNKLLEKNKTNEPHTRNKKIHQSKCFMLAGYFIR